METSVPIPDHALAGEHNSCRCRLFYYQGAFNPFFHRQQVPFINRRFIKTELIEIHQPLALYSFIQLQCWIEDGTQPRFWGGTEGYEMIVRPRSGMSLSGIIIPNSPCTIDAGYRGEIKTPLMNVGDRIVGIKAGDRYAQGTVRPIWIVGFIEVDELPNSNRGTGGFGSTGV